MSAKTLSAPVPSTTASGAVAHGLRSAFAAVSSYLRDFMHAVQWGRMVRVMREMSDRQLAEIGVKRADIPERAHELVYGKH